MPTVASINSKLVHSPSACGTFNIPRPENSRVLIESIRRPTPLTMPSAVAAFSIAEPVVAGAWALHACAKGRASARVSASLLKLLWLVMFSRDAIAGSLSISRDIFSDDAFFSHRSMGPRSCSPRIFNPQVYDNLYEQRVFSQGSGRGEYRQDIKRRYKLRFLHSGAQCIDIK